MKIEISNENGVGIAEIKNIAVDTPLQEMGIGTFLLTDAATGQK